MDWLWKALAVVRGVVATVWGYVKPLWDKLRAGGNAVFDPPPAAIKWYVIGVLVIALGGGIFGAKVKGWFVADRQAIPAMDHFVAIPRAPSVVTTTLPPPSASPKDLPPLKTLKTAEAKKKTGKGKPKPKPKCQAVFC
jgi:hypothetical protein